MKITSACGGKRKPNVRSPLRCKYCGAQLKHDSVGPYCPTKNCEWQYGLPTAEGGMSKKGREDFADDCGPDSRTGGRRTMKLYHCRLELDMAVVAESKLDARRIAHNSMAREMIYDGSFDATVATKAPPGWQDSDTPYSDDDGCKKTIGEWLGKGARND